MGLFDLFRGKNKQKTEPQETAGSAAVPAQGEGSSSEPQMRTLQEIFVENLRFLNKKEYPESFFQGLFTENRLLTVVLLGEADFPSGEIAVGDPLGFLSGGGEMYLQTLNRHVQPGAYPVELAVLRQSAEEIRVAAARVRFGGGAAVQHEITMPAGHTIAEYNQPGVLTGFGVDTGLACICDAQVAVEYRRFFAQAVAEGQNIYVEYFQELFAESYRKLPQFQRPGGDFLLWRVPDTGNGFPLFASGFGDGFYSAYWGLDANGGVCELVVPLVNPEFYVPGQLP